jgi:membrane protein implicated in regulation of membrane protease activity
MTQAMMIWAVAALLLIAAELLLPEIFLLWLGIAAAAVFFIVWAVPGLPPLGQAVAFVLLSFVSIGVYIKFVRGRHVRPDQPMLNKRGEQLVGRVLPLHEAIVNGQGRVKFGDALWTVEGPDMPAGTSVRVVGATSMTLRVEAN